VRTNDGVVLADQILAEGGNSPADVYVTENSPELMLLQEKGLLAPLPSATLSEVPARFRSPTGRWVGIALRVSCLVYDPHLVDKDALPTSILALAQPSWRGRVAIAPTDSDFLPLVGGISAVYGTDTARSWLAGLRRNAKDYEDDESVASAVNSGDAAVGIINQYYWFRLRLEVGPAHLDSELYYFPHHNIGGLENISGAGILASSAHKAAAEQFVNFLVSAQAQRILAGSDDFEYPTRVGIASNTELPRLSMLSPATLSVVRLGNDEQAAQLVELAGLS
jgi:iron(III) transport system substrate-binding protein